MAIFHCSVKTISRGDNRSAVAAAAYRAAQTLTDERTGTTHDYTKKGGVLESFIRTPGGCPVWMQDRAVLWNAAEHAEKRKNSRIAREIVIAMPHELDQPQQSELVRSYVEWLIEQYGVAVDVSMHMPHRQGDERNTHAHILFTTREVGLGGFGKKTRVLDDRVTGPQEILRIRQSWEEHTNAALKRAGMAARVDHRSHKDRGIKALPQIHVGVNAKGMARRGAEPKGSVIHVDFRGREVNYPEIDKGRTREEYNAEIVQIQQFCAEAESASVGELKRKVQYIEALQTSLAGNIADLEASLDSEMLNENLKSFIRSKIERLKAKLLRKKQKETEWEEKRRQEREKAEEIQEKQFQLMEIERQQKQIQERYQAHQQLYEANRALHREISRMSVRLNGIPAYEIRLKTKLSSQFNEETYRGKLSQELTQSLMSHIQGSQKHLKGVEAPKLRMEVLTVKEALSRTLPGNGLPDKVVKLHHSFRGRSRTRK